MLTVALGVAGLTASAWLARHAQAVAVSERLSGRRRRFRLPQALRGRVVRMLDDAGVTWSPEDAVATWVSTTVAAVLLGAALGPLPLLLTVAAAVTVIPAGLRTARARRVRALRTSLPELLDAVARELHAGETAASAIVRLGDRSSLALPAAVPVARRVRLGLGLEEALSAWAESEAGGPAATDVQVVAGALRVAAAGGRAAHALEGLATALREEHTVLAEARAQAAQGRLSAVVVGALPVVALAFSAVFDADAGRALLVHPLGRVALVTGIGLQVAAALWMRRIVEIER